MKKQNRNKERILLLAVTFIITAMFYQYYSNIKGELVETTTAYENINVSNKQVKKTNSSDDKKEKAKKKRVCIQLESGFSKTDLKKILHEGEYFMDEVYEQFFVDELALKMKEFGRIANLGALNKEKFLIDALKIKTEGGDWGEARYQASAIKLGLDSALLAKMDTEYKTLPATVSVGKQKSDIEITGRVEKKKEEVSFFDKLFRRKTNTPVANVLVRLIEERTTLQKDSLKKAFFENASQEELFNTNLDDLVQSPVFYVRTDANGVYAFKNLEKGKNYSVIPITLGKEYGVLKGQAHITESTHINFIEKTHKLPLLGRYNFKRIKSDNLLTVRTPQEFIQNLKISLLLFLLGFWLLHIALSIKTRQGSIYDEYLLPLLMLIIGVGMVVLYAIQNPLSDMDYATDTALYLFVLLVFFSLFVLILNQKKILLIADFRIGNIKQLKNIVNKKGWLSKANRGYGWLILSLIITLALWMWGTGPEGSGVKVNLFRIQVSELAKFFMIIFFARYFTANVGYFRNIPSNRWLIWHNIFMLLGLIVLIALYAILGDLGPALVLCITFFIIYAFAKGEFPQMIGMVIAFVLSLYVISYITDGSSLILSIYSGIVFIALGIYAFKAKRNESLFFMVAVIASFVLLEYFASWINFAERLADRNSMFRDPWSNSLHGGDQVVQGIWSLDSGGLLGQGLGKGLSNVMPAYHTDMIFASIGEELGIITLIVLLVAFGLLFYRSMLIARRTGDSFFYFFINGIAIATMIQLAIIVGGSLGLMPLTGISVPFLSKGNVSLLLNTLAFLLIVSLSQIRGKSIQMKRIKEQFEDMNVYMLLTFIGVILLFSGTLLKYYHFRERDMIRPTQVLSKQGEWMKYYNPRIGIITKELEAGNIYDRNGVLLATSNRNDFLAWEDSAKNNRYQLEAKVFSKQKNSRQNRYYTYGEDLIYYLGDRNTGLVANLDLGYVADYRLAEELLGIEPTLTQVENVMSNEFKEAVYLPMEQKETQLRTYDYSAYIPFLKAGKNSKLIEEFNAKNRDVKLSLDVEMNQIINNIIQNNKKFTNNKISVVALDAQTGEVFASAMNPKPNKQDILKLNQIPPKYYSKLSKIYFGHEHLVVDRDLGMFYRSVPGSTIKVVDALAYLGREGKNGVETSFFITRDEQIHSSSSTVGKVNLHKAIVHSSNVYFIRLVNEKELHPELFALDQSVGINLFDIGGYYLEPGKGYDETEITRQWTELIMHEKGVNYNNPRYLGTKKRYLQSHYSFMAWGQEPVKATPLQMARLYGAIAMQGELKQLCMVKEIAGKEQKNEKGKMLIQNKEDVNNIEVCQIIENAMREQSQERTNSTGVLHYGKTGSPERMVQYFDNEKEKVLSEKLTDGWYVCYIKNTKIGHPLVFATRIEGLPEGGGASGNATALWKEIANSLKDKYFN